MLEGRDFEVMDMVFPFEAAFVDRVTENDEFRPITYVHATYTELANRLKKNKRGKKISLEMLKSFKMDIARLQKMMTGTSARSSK